ncbi:MAG: hypothetical protein EAY81_01715 [Bacteroidetes bacterium]|nr:MAG: hypothetical protein EAY81_01715 [Bacteroidota bacterium]
MKKLLQHQTVVSLADQAMLSGSNFLLGVCIARFLGITVLGEYALMMLYIMLIMGLQQAFIVNPMQQLSARANIALLGYLKQVQVLQLVISLLSASGLTLFLSLSNAITVVEPWVLFLFTFFLLFNETNRKSLYLSHHNLLILATSFISNIIPLIILFILSIYSTLQLNEALFIQSFFYALGAAVGSFPFLLKNHTDAYVIIVIEHFNKSVWLTGTSLLQWFSGNFFMIAANQTLGSTALGAIKMAQNLLGLLNVMLLALENHFPANIARLFLLENHTELIRYMKSFFKQYLFISVALLIGLLLFTNTIIFYVFGPAFIPYAWVVYGFVAIYLVVIIATPLRIAVRVLNKQQAIFWGYLASTVFALAFADTMVQHFGISGVIIGFGIGQVMMLVAYSIGFKQIIFRIPN